MGNVLILTNCSPEDDSGRAGNLKYRCEKLLKKGWSVTVVSPAVKFEHREIPVKHGAIKFIGPKSESETTGDKIANDHPYIRKILKSTILRNNRGVFITDPYIRFLPTTVYKLRSLFEREKFDIMTTQIFPHTNNLIGLLLSKLYDTNWVMEYRDPWVQHPSYFPNGPDFINQRLEERCVSQCDRLLYYDGIQIPDGYFQNEYSTNIDKIKCIGGVGFDERVVENGNIEGKDFDSFTIVYAGNYYGDGEQLNPFFSAVADFIRDRDLDPDDLSILFIGRKNRREDRYLKNIQDMGIGEYIQFIGWMEYERCLEYICGADYALYINRLYEGDDLNISSKMYDYIGCETPVLGLSLPGWRSWELIEEKDIGFVANALEEDDILEQLNCCYDENKTVAGSIYNDFKRTHSFKSILKEYDSLKHESS